MIPESATPGRRTPTFTADTTPPALLKDHHTTVWAELTVLAGSVTFVEQETANEQLATPDNTVTIVPDMKHHIVPSADAEFYVQFYE